MLRASLVTITIRWLAYYSSYTSERSFLVDGYRYIHMGPLAYLRGVLIPAGDARDRSVMRLRSAEDHVHLVS